MVTAQETALPAEIAAVAARMAQLQASATLIVAPGGGWSTAELPTKGGVLPFAPLDVLGPAHGPGGGPAA